MTEFRFANNVYNLTTDQEVYWALLHDIRGNVIFPLWGYIELYENYNNENSLNKYKTNANKIHEKFIGLIEI